MKSSIKIAIPTPCHENWAAMSPADKGRFCGACEKKVYDFTHATDSEIYTAYINQGSLCGRFTTMQLNRELTLAKKSNRKWLSITAAFLGCIALSARAQAQKPSAAKPKVTAVAQKKKPARAMFTIRGTVTDTACNPVTNAFIGIKGKDINTITDSTGYFTLKATMGDVLVCDVVGFKALQQTIAGKENIDFTVQEDMGVALVAYTYTTKQVILGMPTITVTKKRSFFGRILYTISKPFRRTE